MDAIQKANSGHPGLPLGAAEVAAVLYGELLKHNPADSKWVDRDRFVLSAGHGSMLLYSILHLSGYKVSLDDIKSFRQIGSKCPGHPEYGETDGVECTSGPLGQGIAAAVGMAIAETMLAARFNTPKHTIVDHYTYTLVGEGCLEEGVSSEASSLAGNLGLGKLIVFYDENKISIDGNTDITFTDDIENRYLSYGWKVLRGSMYNVGEIADLVEIAKRDTSKPTLIILKSVIGKGAPKQGTADVHGAPLGEEGCKSAKASLGIPSDEQFWVAPEAYKYFEEKRTEWAKAEDNWNKTFAEWAKENPELAKKWDAYWNHKATGECESPSYKAGDKLATRDASGKSLNCMAKRYEWLVGGSADLQGPNKTKVADDDGVYSKTNRKGRTIEYGIREFAMSQVMSGINLHGGLRAFGATFLVFSDYLRPSLRVAALSKLPNIYIFTHDSIYVGEYGPTHQPVEQLAMLRSSIDVEVLRPADANEMLASWKIAVETKNMPVALILTRQPVENLTNSTYEDVLHGAYIARKESGDLEGIIIASGSEVGLAIHAQEELEKQGHSVRVVSMPSMNLFDAQSDEYKESVLPNSCRKRLSVEMLSDFGWHKYVGLDGKTMCVDTFGASAPASRVIKEYGFTVENVVKEYNSL